MHDHPIRNGFIALILVLIVAAIILSFFRASSSNDMSYGDVLALAHQGRLTSVKLSSRQLEVRLRDDTLHHAATGTNPDLVRDLRDAGASVGDGGSGTVEVSYARTGLGLASGFLGGAAALVFLGFVFYAGRWSTSKQGVAARLPLLLSLALEPLQALLP